MVAVRLRRWNHLQMVLHVRVAADRQEVPVDNQEVPVDRQELSVPMVLPYFLHVQVAVVVASPRLENQIASELPAVAAVAKLDASRLL